MAGRSLCLSTVYDGLHGAALFAREPDSDLELEDLESQPGERRGTSNRPAKKPPRSNLPLLLLLLVIVAAGAYLAMNPEVVLTLLGQETSVSAPGPAQPIPKSDPPPGAPPPDHRTERDVPPLAAAVPTPLFAEGQRVTIAPSASAPGRLLPLTMDSAGTQPGPSVGPNAVLTVLDAELLRNTWIYLVRTEEGTRGWIPERQLTPKL